MKTVQKRVLSYYLVTMRILGAKACEVLVCVALVVAAMITMLNFGMVVQAEHVEDIGDNETVAAFATTSDVEAFFEAFFAEPAPAEGVGTVHVTRSLPFDTEYFYDDTIYEGERVVVAEGQEGILLMVKEVVRLEGNLLHSEIVDGEFIEMPVAERVAVGTMQRRSFIWPAHGPVTSRFGPRVTAVGSSDHRGLDIGGRLGQPIFAARDGEVIFSDWNNGGFGYKVRLLHDNGDETLYAHLDEILVNHGERVEQGQTIGRMGSTGVSTGVHLHFEIIVGGVQVDPMRFLG